MQVRTGKPIMDQIVVGKLHIYHRAMPAVSIQSELDWRQEEERFYQAQRQSVLELAALYDHASEQVGEGTASVFAVHAMMLEDDDLVELVRRMLRDRGVTAEYAVLMVGRSFAETFVSMESAYMQARAADIRDLSLRMLRALLGGWREPVLEEPAILVADAFLPSEVMEFDRNLLGLVSRKGSLDSHTAQLLRAYHIPAIVEVDVEDDWDGHLALMDGHQGTIYLDPERTLMDQLREQYQQGGAPELTVVS